MTARRVVVAAVGVLSLVATGCTGGSQPTPEPSSSGTQASTASPGTPTSSAPASSAPVTTSAPAPTSSEPSVNLPFGTVPVSNEPPSVGAASGVTKTRVGSHDGYDRAVIELTGGDSAGLWWRAEYDPEPATQGQGAAVDLPGSATLRLILRGQTTPPPSPVVSGEQPGGSAGQITAVYVDPVFEGQSVVFIGVEQQVPFRVFTLDSPTRVVVDFQS